MATKVDPRIERNRAAILDAAQSLLAEEGWEAVTQERVATRSGVGRSTVYRHWPDRTMLLIDTINLVGRSMHRKPTGILRTDLVGELDRFRTMVSGPVIGGLLATLAHGAHRDPALDDAKQRTTKFHTTPVRAAVERAIEAGGLDPATDPDEAVAELFGPISFRVLLSGEAVSRRFVEHIVDRFIAVSQPGRAVSGSVQRPAMGSVR